MLSAYATQARFVRWPQRSRMRVMLHVAILALMGSPVLGHSQEAPSKVETLPFLLLRSDSSSIRDSLAVYEQMEAKLRAIMYSARSETIKRAYLDSVRAYGEDLQRLIGIRPDSASHLLSIWLTAAHRVIPLIDSAQALRSPRGRRLVKEEAEAYTHYCRAVKDSQ